MSKPTSDCRATERKHTWPMVRLGDVCNEIKDRIQSSKIAVDEYVTTDNMVKDRGGVVRAEYVPSGVGLVEYRKGDVLIANIRPYLKKIWLADHDGGCSSDVVVFRTNTDGLSSEYLYSVLSQDAYFEYVMQKPRGTKMPRGDRNWMKEFRFPLPPLPVQREIVARLERELAAVEKMKKGFEALAETAKAEFKAELKEVFEGLKSGETGIGTDGTNGTVETRRLGEICENLDCRRVPITKSDREVGKYPYYGASGIVDWVSGYIFDGDYLLVSEDGANLIARSTPIAFSVSGKIWVNNHAHILLFPDLATQRFVEFYFASIKIDDFVTGAAQPKLTQNALNSIAIPLPSLTVQREVVARLDLAKARAEKLETKAREGVAVCETMRKAILKEAFAPCGAGEVS